MAGVFRGQEQYHSGLLERDNSLGRGCNEAVDADVALLHDFENLWATGVQPNSPDFDYFEHQQTYSEALRSYGVDIDIDIVHPETELSAYSAVIALDLHLVR